MDVGMNTISLTRWVAVAGLAVLVASGTSCMTTYDANGNPVQSVDPGLAVAGAAAAGVLGYAIANDNNHNNYYYNGGGYYAPRGPYYYGGGGYNRYNHGGGYRGGYRGGRR